MQNGFGRTYPFDGAPASLPSGWLDSEYDYGNEQPHAVNSVDSVAGLDEYSYDPNGNMTTRVESAVEWTQVFNAENRLASVSNGTDTWTFVYDGDGNRVKQVNPDGSITLMLGGGIYTVEDATGTPEVTKYYSIAGQRVALSGPDGLQFLLTDHLGSVVGVADSAGGLLSEQRYMPFGGERLTPDIGETDFGFTGQRDLAAVELMDYNARFYAAGIGRFASADTIVPQMFRPQSLNRFAYVENNPSNFIDPTGHALCSSVDGSCTANYVQPAAAPSPSPSPTSPTKTTNTTSTGSAGYQDINKGIEGDLASDNGVVCTSVDCNFADVTSETLGDECLTGIAACTQDGMYGFYYEMKYDGGLIPIADLGVKGTLVVSALFFPPALPYLAAANLGWSFYLATRDPARVASFVARQQIPPSLFALLGTSFISAAQDVGEIINGTHIVPGNRLQPIPQAVPNPSGPLIQTTPSP